MIQLVSVGKLRAHFDQNSKMDAMDFVTNRHEEYISREVLVQSAAESPDIKQSPNISKSGSKRARGKQPQQVQDQPRQVPIPDRVVTDYGVTVAIQQFLEVSSLLRTSRMTARLR